jgi:small subunit ribosomal protein S9
VNALVKNLAVATGKRKTSIARVFLRDGAGAIVVNGKPYEEYFAGMKTVQNVRSPMDVTNNVGKFNVMITVRGGGVISQIEACRHGMARALDAYDSTNHTALRANGFLTRDPRMVERKKYGQAGARRRFQFSKR